MGVVIGASPVNDVDNGNDMPHHNMDIDLVTTFVGMCKGSIHIELGTTVCKFIDK